MGKKLSDNGWRVSKDGLLPGILFTLLVRWCVAAYPYSGYKSPPMFGDFEAQRHWQEITVHTPIDQWYHNTTQNNLEYWGLDYPPLTAYHSYLMGLVADWLDPESVQLFASRGYEKESHKSFMRWTVFLCDVYFYVTAVLCICIDVERFKGKEKNVFKKTDIAAALFLLYPGIILIDHGHFQYNVVSLGLFLWATFFLIGIENDILATVFFVLALNYKQMELYHALPFFFYLLRNCFKSATPSRPIVTFIHRFNQIAIAVVCCFIILWIPFLTTWESATQVVHRLFPLDRGVFEDKVSNVWCTINNFVKLRQFNTNQMMVKICMTTTALAAMPSCLDLFFRQNKRKFVLSLINVSLAFFLFSYQVHEKSILLCAIPVALYMPYDPFACFWFLLVTNFSMLPLLLRDGLMIPYLATNIVYMSFYSIALKLGQPQAGWFSMFDSKLVNSCANRSSSREEVVPLIVGGNFLFSIIGMTMLTIGAIYGSPPPQMPDIFPVVISAYSCMHFLMFYLYFNVQQLAIPRAPPIPKKSKIK